MPAALDRSNDAGPPDDEAQAAPLISEFVAAGFIADRAQRFRRVDAVSRVARDLAGAFASFSIADNPRERMLEVIKIGDDVADRCVADLSRIGGMPDWLRPESLHAQISSLMWPLAAHAIAQGAPAEGLRSRLHDIFMTLVTSGSDAGVAPDYAKLPNGISVAMTENRMMAENVIPHLMRVANDRNASYYVTDMVAFSASTLSRIRAVTVSIVRDLIGDRPDAAEQRVQAYQSMFGTASVLMGQAVRRAHRDTFDWVKERVESPSGIAPRDARSIFSVSVDRRFDAGISLLRQTFAAADSGGRPSADVDIPARGFSGPAQ